MTSTRNRKRLDMPFRKYLTFHNSSRLQTPQQFLQYFNCEVIWTFVLLNIMFSGTRFWFIHSGRESNYLLDGRILAKSCHKLPEVAPWSQKLSEVAKSCQLLPQVAKSYQKVLKDARRCQELPKGALGCQKVLQVVTSCLNMPKFDKKC